MGLGTQCPQKAMDSASPRLVNRCYTGAPLLRLRRVCRCHTFMNVANHKSEVASRPSLIGLLGYDRHIPEGAKYRE